jgi:hypothetical protein
MHGPCQDRNSFIFNALELEAAAVFPALFVPVSLRCPAVIARRRMRRSGRCVLSTTY